MTTKNKKMNIRLLDILLLLLVVLGLYVTWDMQRDFTDMEARLTELEQPRLRESGGGPPMVATHLISGHFCSEKHEGDVIFFDNAGEVTTWSTVKKLADIENEEPSGSGEYEVKGSILKMNLEMKDGGQETHTFNVYKITRFDGIVSIIGDKENGVFSKESCEQE